MLSREQLSAMGVTGLQCGGGQTLLPNCLNIDAMEIRVAIGVCSEIDKLVEVAPRCFFLRRDLTKPLPCEDASLHWSYSEHFIEHIHPEAALAWIKEVRRVLRSGSVFRISTPDLAKYAQGYLDPDNRFYQVHRERLAKMGVKASTRKAWMLNQIFRFWGHAWLYDFEELRLVLSTAGFLEDKIRLCSFRQGKVAEIASFDREIRNDESFYVEAEV